jgi:hypothetical protein
MSEGFQESGIDEAPVSEVITGADPEAPYGRFRNGNPRKTPPKTAKAPKAKSSRYQTKTKTDYRPGLQGFAQIGAFVTSFFSPIDAVAVQDHAPNIIEGAQVTADQHPAFAAKLDKVLAAGPWAALISPCVPLVVQILHNHGKIPGEAVKQMGGRTRDEVMADLMSQAA